MKTCPKCGTACEDQVKFCLNCGEPFPEESKIAAPAGGAEPDFEEPAAGGEFADTIADAKSGAAAAASESAGTAAGAGYAESAAGIGITESPASFGPAPGVDITPNTGAAPSPGPAPSPGFMPVSDIEEDARQKRKNKKELLEEGRPEKKTMSVFAVLSVIFAIIGVFAGGYGCLISFLNFGIALLFYLPSVLGIVFGLIAVSQTGRDRKHKGRILAFAGLIIGALAIVLWLIATFYLRGAVRAEFGTMDLMSVIRVITTKTPA